MKEKLRKVFSVFMAVCVTICIAEPFTATAEDLRMLAYDIERIESPEQPEEQETTEPEETSEPEEETSAPTEDIPMQTTTTRVTTTVTTTSKATTRPEDYKGYDYEARIAIECKREKWCYYEGEEFDINGFNTKISFLLESGQFTEPVNGYSVGNYDEYYTLDISEVNMNKPGEYKVYIDTVPDKIIDVNLYSYVEGSEHVPCGRYNVKLLESRLYTTITVREGERPPAYKAKFTFGDRTCACPDGGTAEIPLFNCVYPEIRVISGNPSSVEVVGFEMYEDPSSQAEPTWGYVTVKGHSAGETVMLTAIDGEGRSTRCDVYVTYTDESYPEGALYFQSDYNLLKCYAGEYSSILIKGFEFDSFCEPGESPVSFSIDDESVAELAVVQGDIVNIVGVSPGETVLRAEAPDGRTAEIAVLVEEKPVTTTRVETTVAYDNEGTMGTVDMGSRIPGDINGDKRVNVADIVLLQKILNNKTIYSKNADMNRDGTVNVFDMILLKRIVLGIN